MAKSGPGQRRRRVVGLLLLLAAALALALLCRGCGEKGDDLRTLPGRQAALRAYGWEIDPESEEHRSVRIPESLEGVLRDYNELQLEQGFDLSKHLGETCEQYSYTVTNYPDPDCTVLVTLYLRGRELIAGDVHSTALNGFMTGLQRGGEMKTDTIP